MNKDAFGALFERALVEAVSFAGIDDVPPVPTLVIEFHGLGKAGDTLTVAEAVELLYISDDRFYRIVDLGVRAAHEGPTRIFLRPSGHQPEGFDKTWSPEAWGPFRFIGRIGG